MEDCKGPNVTDDQWNKALAAWIESRGRGTVRQPGILKKEAEGDGFVGLSPKMFALAKLVPCAEGEYQWENVKLSSKGLKKKIHFQYFISQLRNQTSAKCQVFEVY